MLPCRVTYSQMSGMKVKTSLGRSSLSTTEVLQVWEKNQFMWVSVGVNHGTMGFWGQDWFRVECSNRKRPITGASADEGQRGHTECSFTRSQHDAWEPRLGFFFRNRGVDRVEIMKELGSNEQKQWPQGPGSTNKANNEKRDKVHPGDLCDCLSKIDLCTFN